MRHDKTQEGITWRAVYKGGSFLAQYNKDGTVNKYKDIDRDRLERFDLLRHNVRFYSVYLQDNQRLIYRRRTLIRMKTDDLGEQEREVIYLVGYQTTIGGKNLVVLNYIYHDGKIELDNSRSNIELYDEEKG